MVYPYSGILFSYTLAISSQSQGLPCCTLYNPVSAGGSRRNIARFFFFFLSRATVAAVHGFSSVRRDPGGGNAT